MQFEVVIAGEPKSVSIEGALEDVPAIGELRGKLRDRYLREPGVGADVAEARAKRTVNDLVRAALSDFGNSFVKGKSLLLDQILVARSAIHDFYGALMSAKGEPPKIEDVRAKFGELRKALQDVAKPADELAKEATAGDELAAEKKKLAEELPKTEPPKGAKVPQEAGTARLKKKLFRWIEAKKAWVKRYRTGHVEYRIANERYTVESYAKGSKTPDYTFSEYDTFPKPYKDKPLSSSVMQAHHGLQDALMEFLFGATGRNRRLGLGYDGGEAPTIWLRNSTGESPHGRITHELQNPSQTNRMNDPELSYAKIRDWGVADLKAIGCPENKIAEYLDAIDKHFADKILPRIQAAVKNGRMSPSEAARLIGGQLFGKVVP